MKKLFFACLAMLGLASCDSFETSSNGSFDGYWQMTQVDSLDNGVSVDVREKMIFWSVQSGLLEMSDRHAQVGDNAMPVFFRFERQGDTLHISTPIINNRRISDKKADQDAIRYYGMNRLEETFLVLKLESSKMTLQMMRPDAPLRLHFRKY